MNKNNILSALKNAGYTGSEKVEDVKAYVDANNISLVDADGKAIDLDATFKTVVVTIVSDSGEEVMCNDMPMDTAASQDGTMTEGEAVEMCQPKPAKTAAVQSTNTKGVHMFNIGNDKESFARKNYNRLAAQGKAFFADADEAEAAGAWFRYKLLNNIDGYDQKKRDLEVINKTWSTSSGSLVPTFIETYIQENLNKYGVARKVVGDNLHRMRSLTLNLNDLTADAVVTVPSQGSAGDDNSSTPTLAGKTLTAIKAIGTKQITSELLNDSPVNVADYIARAFTRAIAKVEDQYYISNATSGLLDNSVGVQAGGVVSGTGIFNKTWTSVTDTDINRLMSKLHNGYNHNEAAFMCSRAYYFQVLYRLQKAAGGITLNEAMNGVKSLFPYADASYFGVPVYFSELFTAVSGTQGAVGVARRPIAYGVFGQAHAFGVVDGSMEIASSSEFAFDKDVLTIRAKERFAVKAVNLGTGSVAGGIVVAEQDV
jgi:hypothetical protein